MNKLIFALSICSAIFLQHARAESTAPVYRWKDAKGEINFGQVPPRDRPYTLLKAGGKKPVTATIDGEIVSEGNSGLSGDVDSFLKKAEAEREAREEAKAKALEAKLEARKKCDAARERAQFLEERTARRLVVKAEDGNYARLEEDEFLKRLDAARQAVAEHCE